MPLIRPIITDLALTINSQLHFIILQHMEDMRAVTIIIRLMSTN